VPIEWLPRNFVDEIEMPEVDAEAFNILVHWLYAEWVDTIEAGKENLIRGMKVYVLADNRMLPNLQDAVKKTIRRFIRKNRQHLHPRFAVWVTESLNKDCLLHRCIGD
jgi:hypothetical protein